MLIDEIIKKIIKWVFVFFGISFGIMSSLLTLCRYIQFNNNELLMHYEEYEPDIYLSYLCNELVFEYVLENGTVYRRYPLAFPGNYSSLSIYDNKRKWLKQYNGNVLFMITDQEECEFLQAFNLLNLLEPDRHWKINTQEECEEINELLNQGKYEYIKKFWKKRVFTTSKGTIYIN